ncbi:hypothetical protein [Paenirhodobacter populi]|uniref:Uncharacterized protein n=1 Tax=Paenirhodobacter populi TaxID=2306993 RepID=A0A443IRV5_9RHOB|nr:hypothetical protein [Sinirhodobacter populi]RWR10018.1 hypothetical protein D2T33_13585 [Sinirhodobacter populi]
MIRPELRERLHRHRELIAAIAAIAAGLWIASLGGWLLIPVGLLVAAAACAWATSAWRRGRFTRPVTDPGVVEVIEGRIGYFGAGQMLGGYVSIDDLAEIRLLTLRSARYWRLKTADGQAILVPVAAAGAEALYDAFAALPDIDMRRLTAALESDIVAQRLWTRQGLRDLDTRAR